MPFVPSSDQFGWLKRLAPAGTVWLQNLLRASGRPATFRRAAPHLVGTAEDKPVSLHDTFKRLFGDWHPSQNQPRGTCVSRGAKMGVDLTQAVVIANGGNYEYAGVSHAWIYGACREHGGGLGDEDGAVGSWAAWTVSNDGNLKNTDCDDDDNSDTLAVKWGKTGVPKELRPKAKPQVIEAVAQAQRIEDVRDGLLHGYCSTVASDVGFEPTERDQDGVCKAGGYWPHQMLFSGYHPNLAGRGPHYQCNQSWGPNQPSGPIGPYPMPTYCFWVSEPNAIRMVGQQDTWILSGYRGWPGNLLEWDV